MTSLGSMDLQRSAALASFAPELSRATHPAATEPCPSPASPTSPAPGAKALVWWLSSCQGGILTLSSPPNSGHPAFLPSLTCCHAVGTLIGGANQCTSLTQNQPKQGWAHWFGQGVPVRAGIHDYRALGLGRQPRGSSSSVCHGLERGCSD